MKIIKIAGICLVIVGALAFVKLKFFKGVEDLSKAENKKGGSKTASPVNVEMLGFYLLSI